MKTVRYNSAVVSDEKFLIVAGGYRRPIAITTVDVMDTENKVWYSASNLPIPLSEASATIFKDRLFIAGGWSLDKRANKSVFSCLISNLVALANKGINDMFVWEKVAELSVSNATCTTVCGRLVLFGGLNPDNKASNDIRIYNSITGCFEPCGMNLLARYSCMAAPLPNNSVMVIGGYTDEGTTNTVEIAIVHTD